MIEQAMKLKDPLDLFAIWHSDNIKLDQLTLDDWEKLTWILALLKPFHELTLHMEGRAKDGKCRSV